jgi:hypothetical protein
MLWRKIAVLTTASAALGAATPVFADHPRWAPAHGHRAKHFAPRVVPVYPRPYVVVPRQPVVAYRAPVYYGPPPAPAYRGHYGYGYDYAASGALAGAVAGARIGGSVTPGHDRVAGVAIGSVLGAVIGHELGGGY